ncbi:MAG TPA: protein-L-isoaspartate(D-aspartate) O-methyltransferase [Methylotenera sp.]|nr:protein-L-isoaspartate(D-aspartate) O-methyltransferase [Methylotenera sp.]HPV44741.1 protein-L-isoaspartate(D-aspartate) O-methyltransferase [Methylotenera sp.]
MLRILVIACFIILQPYVWAVEPDFAAERRALMVEISALAKETRSETGQGVISAQVMEAMGRVPRHIFVPPEVRHHAYRNRPLPIGYSQTISQPFLVAYMTELLQVNKDSKVLEVGAGSGYQAAILGELVKEVYTIEIIKPLAERASETLKSNGYINVQVQVGDGYYGWKKHAPFDAIIVTAAASHVPPPLIQQLKRGGRMLIPLGSSFMPQHLVLVEKDMQDRVRTRELLPVQFVPLTGGH